MGSSSQREFYEKSLKLSTSHDAARQNSINGDAAVLNSWKEISHYLGRAVRTVQRWESDLGLPVRRPTGKDRSAVLAIPKELDEWLQHAPLRANDNHRNPELNATKLLEIGRALLREAELLIALQDKQQSQAGPVVQSLREIVRELTLMTWQEPIEKAA